MDGAMPPQGQMLGEPDCGVRGFNRSVATPSSEPTGSSRASAIRKYFTESAPEWSSPTSRGCTRSSGTSRRARTSSPFYRHPYADSMATHMELIMEHIGESYAEYLEPESTLQIYGTLSDELAQTIDGASHGRTDEAAPIPEPIADLSRLPAV